MFRMVMASLVISVIVVPCIGCGSSQAKLVNDLKQTGLVYHTYHDDHKQGPPGWDALIECAEKSNLSGDSIRRVRDAGYELKWNVRFNELVEGSSTVVLGERSSGGPKLMMDGGVRQ